VFVYVRICMYKAIQMVSDESVRSCWFTPTLNLIIAASLSLLCSD